MIAGINFTVVLLHVAHLSAQTPNPSSSLALFPSSAVHLFFPLAPRLFPLLIPLFPHHSNANHLRYLLPPAFPALTPNHQSPPSALLSQQIIPSAHTVNLIDIPSDAPASSAKQQVVVAGNQNKSPFSTVTDCPYQAAKPHTRSKWNAKNYLNVNGEKTLL